MMTRSQVAAWVVDCLSGIYRPMPKETIWAWAERTLKIPRGGENSEMAGQPWSSAYSPYVREIMEWFRLPGKHELFICKSSQIGITMAVLIVICWHIVHRPVNIGYYIDSREEARNISKIRLKKWIKDNRLLDELNENEDDLSNFTYFLRSMVVYLFGAYAEGGYRNKALGIGILDELDAHPPVDEQGVSADNVRSRLKRDRNSKLIGFSKPKTTEHQTWQEYLTGTREKYFVPCPCCGHMQPLEWKQMRYGGQEFEDLAGKIILLKVKAGTWYQCELGCRIEMSQRFDMLQKGEWRATNPDALPNKRSMQISDLYSHFVSWGELAVEWIAAQNSLEKLIAFRQDRLGLPPEREAGKVKEKDVLNCRDPQFRRGTSPIKPVLVALLVDVQQSTMKWVIAVYSGLGDLLPVDWGETASWGMIAEKAESSVKSAWGEHVVECGFIDEGDGNRADEVRKFTDGYDHIFPVKGRGETQIKELIYPSRTWLGDHEILTYHVNDNVYKEELVYRRIRGGKRRRRWGCRRLILPKDVTPEFVDELMGERRIDVPNRYRQMERKWKKFGTNDYLDCLKYGLALWDLMETSLRDAGRIEPLPPLTEEKEDDPEEEAA